MGVQEYQFHDCESKARSVMEFLFSAGLLNARRG